MIDLLDAVVTGVGIFLFGQLLQRYILDPLQAYRELIGKVAAAYTYYQGMATQLAPTEDRIAARKELRSLAAELRACFWKVPFYRFWSIIRVVRRRKQMMAASTALIGWGNSIYSARETDGDENKERLETLKKTLGFNW
jgi:hypothetical protein